MLIAQSNLMPLVALAGVGLVIAMLLIRGSRGRRRSSEGPIERAPRPAADRPRYSGRPPELDRWQVEMHETARELSARLDSKMSALQALIADADRAADRLEQARRQTHDQP